MESRKRIRRLAHAVLLCGLGAASAAPAGAASAPGAVDPEGGVIATVNGEPIYFEDLERLLGQMHESASMSQDRRRAPNLEKAVFRLVNDALLAQEARSLGLHDEEPIASQVASQRESLAVSVLEREEIWELAEPTEEEIAGAFAEEHRTITFRMLTAHEREQAEELLGGLKHGADFAALAGERSLDPYSQRGGLVEDLARIDMPRELAAEAFAASPGELKGPVRTRLGWAVLQVESIAEADPQELEELRPSLQKLVRYRKAEELRKQLEPRLREAHPVRIDEAALAAVAPTRLPDARLVPEVESPDAVIAWIGARSISAGQLGQALRLRWTGVRNEEAALAARPLVLERMIREELMKAEALARGYGDTQRAQRALRTHESRLLIPRFLQEVVVSDIHVSPEEMQRHYEAQKESYRKPPRLSLRQITVETEEQAGQLAELLRQGTDPGWLARQHSIDRYAEAGGERGWVTLGRAGDPLEQSLLEAEPGEVLGPTESPRGFVVVQVAAREEQGLYTFDEISGNVRQALRDQKAQLAIHEFIQIARSRSEIEVDDEVLASLSITGAQGEAAGHDTPPPHSQQQPEPERDEER